MFIVFGAEKLKSMTSQMGRRGGSRKPEDMDLFYFSRDDPSMFWDTAVPALCLKKGMDTTGVSLHFSLCGNFVLLLYS